MAIDLKELAENKYGKPTASKTTTTEPTVSEPTSKGIDLTALAQERYGQATNTTQQTAPKVYPAIPSLVPNTRNMIDSVLSQGGASAAQSNEKVYPSLFTAVPNTKNMIDYSLAQGIQQPNQRNSPENINPPAPAPTSNLSQQEIRKSVLTNPNFDATAENEARIAAQQTERNTVFDNGRTGGGRTAEYAQKPTVGGAIDLLGKSALSGMAQFNKGVSSTVDFLLPTEFLGDKDVISNWNDYTAAGARNMEQQRADAAARLGGGGWNVASQLAQMTTAAIPNAILALASGGGSAVTQLSTQASGVLSSAARAAAAIAKNPLFWTSFAQTTGNTYEEAKAEGASDLAATLTAVVTGLLNSAVEVSGGLETLPKELRTGSTSQVRKWIESMLQEGGEEVIQGVIDNLSKKIIYDFDKPFASPTDENAVLNHLRFLKELGGGAAVGGILGGGQILAQNALNSLPRSTPKPKDNLPDLAPKPTIAQEPVQPSTSEVIPPTLKADTAQRSASQGQTNIIPQAKDEVKQNTAKAVNNKNIEEIHIDDRDYKNVSSRKVNAFQFDNPELHGHFTVAANALFTDLQDSVKGERWAVKDADGYFVGGTGVKRSVSPYIARLLDNAKISYAQIEKAINDIIINHGQENYSAAKKVELVLDDMLTNGYKVEGHRVEPDYEYLLKKEAIKNSTDYKMTEEEWNSLLENIPANVPEGVTAESSVGAATGGFDPFSKLSEQYGAIPEGENATRVVDVPKQTTDKDRVSRAARTVLEAAATPDKMVEPIEQFVVDGKASYIPITNKGTEAKARAAIEKKGFREALKDWEKDVRDGKAGADLVATGAILYNNAANAGDGQLALDILSSYMELNTRSGQSAQAARILKQLTPEGRLYAIARETQKINDLIPEKIKEKLGDISISDELATEFLEAQTDEQRDAVIDKIYQHIADQIPASGLDKFTALRYLNMLGNIKTQVRNVAGNTTQQILRISKDRLAALMEITADKVSRATGGKGIERTKSIMLDSELFALAIKDSKSIQKELLGEAKYSAQSTLNKSIQDKRTIFKFKPLETYRKITHAAMEYGDVGFSMFAYADALSGYLRANKVTAEQMASGKVDTALMDKARNYAITEAQKSTFRDRNAFSDAIASMGFKNADNFWKKAVNGVLAGVVPFRRTPANIIVRAEEYSPLGFANAIYEVVQLNKGNEGASLAKVFDSLSKAITGTGLFALGMYLFNQGFVTGGEDDDEKQGDFDELQGKQKYSLNFPNGKSITLDWLTPASIPFFMGAKLANNAMQEGWSLVAVSNAIGSITNPMLQMSMLQGVNDALDNISYSDNKLVDFALNAFLGVASQALTNTMGGQIERSLEKVRMTTYTDKNNQWLSPDVQYPLGRATAKIPGVDFQQIPFIDAWGRQESSGSTGKRIGENLFSPFYTSKVETSPMEQELQRLYDDYAKEQGTKVFPSRALRYIEYSKEEYDLTADEYVKFATTQGQLAYNTLTEIVDTRAYKNMDDQQRASLISNVYGYARDIAKREYFTDKGIKYESSDYEKTYDAVNEMGIDLVDYLLYRSQASALSSDKDKDGNPIPNSEKEKDIKLIHNTGLTKKQKDYLYLSAGYSESGLADTPWH